MAYRTYTTEAIVCGSRDSYTSDRSFLLFTDRGGMLWASARSVREERSRQRYALQPFSLIRVSLVKGRSGWRVGSVSAASNAYQEVGSKDQRGAVTRVLRLLRQYVHGEEPHEKIFQDTTAVLKQIRVTYEAQLNNLTEGFYLRLLHHLGYVPPNESYKSWLESDSWLLGESELPKAAKIALERAQMASHL